MTGKDSWHQLLASTSGIDYDSSFLDRLASIGYANWLDPLWLLLRLAMLTGLGDPLFYRR